MQNSAERETKRNACVAFYFKLPDSFDMNFAGTDTVSLQKRSNPRYSSRGVNRILTGGWNSREGGSKNSTASRARGKIKTERVPGNGGASAKIFFRVPRFPGFLNFP